MPKWRVTCFNVDTRIRRAISLATACCAVSFMTFSPVAHAMGGLGTNQVSLPLVSGADPYAPAVARLVHAIVEYSRWPGDKRDLTICLVRPSAHAEAIAPSQLSRGRSLSPAPVSARPSALQACDALYIGRLSLSQQRLLIDAVRGRGVLTIAEADPDCQSQAMVCLVYEPDGLTFQLNIDAVSRSGIALDARVLRIAKNVEGRP